jgi:hypothetical protein
MAIRKQGLTWCCKSGGVSFDLVEMGAAHASVQ